MARRTVVEWIDDIDGTAAAETMTFAIDGMHYEIDLSTKNAAKFRGVMARWIEASRRSSQRRSRGESAGVDLAEATKARQWAIENGLDVGPRGRLPSDILEAYRSSGT
ncbi:Lsr2 family protein [Mycolicibacterium sp. 050158]|uniref:histone-like nucleoid-structuring protein Lsr2 n=1 Tax=Mycolicibacterium sp. 050158 TaxID=3090602 RepID=UPI00299D6974|nr:Lsr2 family protein [Mycolicibacterium sp. 050158]MDX1889335.1 Lsr2 family protein [Mycolicibacterium sp. 050158]